MIRGNSWLFHRHRRLLRGDRDCGILAAVCPCRVNNPSLSSETHMKSYRSFVLTVLSRSCHPIAWSLALCILFSCAAFGQQAQTRKRVPVLTTDDVVRERPQSQVVETPGVEGKAKAGDSEKPAATTAGTKVGSDGKVDPAEAAWRERVEKARAKAKAAQRSAEEAELRINELRNQLGSSGGTPKDRNQTAAELDQMGQRTKELRAEARAA